jgi:hypothetical protein
MIHKVLCVTEGEKGEIKILKALSKCFDVQVEIVPFSAEIYQLYQLMNNSGEMGFEENLWSVLKQRYANQPISADFKKVLDRYNRDDFAEIYLFFDFDGHTTFANNDKMAHMLQFFDNETENGKLYISYPMLEAYKDCPIPQKLTPISLGADYKALVNQSCDQQIHRISLLTKEQWTNQLSLHLQASNLLATGQSTIPTYETLFQELSQHNLFLQQLEKHIKPSQEVMILSAFALFLVEYKGHDLLQEWLKSEA